MQIRQKNYGIKGFYKLARYASKWGMINTLAKKRIEILTFWKKHGLEATLDAFKVSRRTLYGWKARLNTCGGDVAGLNNRSRTPHTRRKRL